MQRFMKIRRVRGAASSAVFEMKKEIPVKSLRGRTLLNSHSFCRTVLLASILSLLFLPAFSAAQETHPLHWDYSGPEDPSHWGKLDPVACVGSQRW